MHLEVENPTCLKVSPLRRKTPKFIWILEVACSFSSKASLQSSYRIVEMTLSLCCLSIFEAVTNFRTVVQK